MSLTEPQKDALLVLEAHGRTRASKEASSLTIARVNHRAAQSLEEKGLARGINPDVERGYVIDDPTRNYVTQDEYLLTDTGLALARQLRRAEGTL